MKCHQLVLILASAAGGAQAALAPPAAPQQRVAAAKAPQLALAQVAAGQAQSPLPPLPLLGEVPQMPGAPQFAEAPPAAPDMLAMPAFSPAPGYALPQVPPGALPPLPVGQFPAGVAPYGADAAAAPLPPLPALPPLPPDEQALLQAPPLPAAVPMMSGGLQQPQLIGSAVAPQRVSKPAPTPQASVAPKTMAQAPGAAVPAPVHKQQVAQAAQQQLPLRQVQQRAQQQAPPMARAFLAPAPVSSKQASVPVPQLQELPQTLESAAAVDDAILKQSLPDLSGGVQPLSRARNLDGQQLLRPPLMWSRGVAPMMVSPTKPDTVAALQTGQFQAPPAPYDMQKQMVSAIQTQYNTQLEEYKSQQRQFADWAKKYEEYERTVTAQQRQYQLQQQRYQALGQQESQMLRRQRAAPGALVQTGARAESARESALASRERTLAARGETVAAQERELREKAAQVRARELHEETEQSNLDARAQALAKKEKDVQVFESELVREQKKIWKVLRSRRGPAPAAVEGHRLTAIAGAALLGSSQTGAAPSAPAERPRQRAARPARVQAVARQHRRKRAPLALAQLSSGSKTKRVRAFASSGGSAAAAASTAAHSSSSSSSDLQVVMAAKTPVDSDEADDDAEAPAAISKAVSDEDAQGTDEDAKGTNEGPGGAATADNDDLEELGAA